MKLPGLSSIQNLDQDFLPHILGSLIYTRFSIGRFLNGAVDEAFADEIPPLVTDVQG